MGGVQLWAVHFAGLSAAFHTSVHMWVYGYVAHPLCYTDLGMLDIITRSILLLQMPSWVWAESWSLGRTRSKLFSKWWKTPRVLFRLGYTACWCLCIACFVHVIPFFPHHFTSLISLSFTETMKGKKKTPQTYGVYYILIMALVWEWSLQLTLMFLFR